jgi:formylglycine-generating enzyme required for sulfatase activity/serine/threonine protein kinase
MALDLAPDETLIQRLPLPLAQLYRRAFNAKSALERHQAAFYLFEAGLKLLGSVCVVEYANLSEHDPALAEALENLSRPALGHWWEFVRKLVPVLADKNVAGFLSLQDFILGKPRTDLPRTAALNAALLEALENKRSGRATVSISDLFDLLVAYRNRQLGHAGVGMASTESYERLGRSLLFGISELWSKFDVLAGRQLLFITEVRQAEGFWRARRFELIGENARQLNELVVSKAQAALVPDGERVYVGTPNSGDDLSSITRLHPLCIFDLESNRCAFLNSRRGKQKIEYLCYTTSEIQTRPELGGEQRALLAKALGLPEVSESKFGEWQQRSQTEDPQPELPASTARRHLGEFELISELGRGGMGIVYRARQPGLERQVAVKRLFKPGDAKAEGRFRREIRSLGQVEHPNIVKVFSSGSDGDQWYFVMELVEGVPLSAVCEKLSSGNATDVDFGKWQAALSTVCEEMSRNETLLSDGPSPQPSTPRGEGEQFPPLSPGGRGDGGEGDGALQSPSLTPPMREGAKQSDCTDYICTVVELMRQTADAIHALNERGILHRDIKPGNILINAEGTHATLIDLGLAKFLHDLDDKLTKTRGFVGTLRYASPEQVLAAGPLDRRSDVYSLGATLWELLALKPLYGATGETPEAELMQRIQYTAVEPLRKYNPAVPAELEAIVHHCLEKNRDNRYASAGELAVDLGRWLRGEAISLPTIASDQSIQRTRVGRLFRYPLIACALALSVFLLLNIVKNHTTRQDPGTEPNTAAFFEEGEGIDLGHGIIVQTVRIKANSRSFQMGSPESEVGHAEDEGLHAVAFTYDWEIGKFTVTLAQFKRFIEENPDFKTDAETNETGGYGWNEPEGKFESGKKYNWKFPGFRQEDDHPIVNVSWNDAKKFCEWASQKTGKVVRLPLEAEWEYSCRAGTSTRYFSGNDDQDLREFANVPDSSLIKRIKDQTQFEQYQKLALKWDDGYPFTAPVGKFRPNPWGLYDMVGNVWQWLDDGYAAYPKEKVTDPQGPAEAQSMVRGGSFRDPRGCRIAFRYDAPPTARYCTTGFRLAVPIRSPLPKPRVAEARNPPGSNAKKDPDPAAAGISKKSPELLQLERSTFERLAKHVVEKAHKGAEVISSDKYDFMPKQDNPKVWGLEMDVLARLIAEDKYFKATITLQLDLSTPKVRIMSISYKDDSNRVFSSDELEQLKKELNDLGGFNSPNVKPSEVSEFQIADDVKMKFCWIPPGEAQLGAPKEELDYIAKEFYAHLSEWPVWMASETENARGKYTSKGFWLGKYTVTQAQWQAVMSKNPSHFVPTTEKIKKDGITNTDHFPVETVSFGDCHKFLKLLNERGGEKVFGKQGKFVLPHEDEWEYACRGGLGNGKPFYFGNILNGVQANTNGMFPYGTAEKGPFKERTTRVGEYEDKFPHPWGLCDMHGNVRQWCANTFNVAETDRAVRGGDWSTKYPYKCRAAYRSSMKPDKSDESTGFRVCYRPE